MKKQTGNILLTPPRLRPVRRTKGNSRKGTQEGFVCSEDWFRNIFENAAAGMVITDPDRNYLAVNDKFCEITGYSREALLTMGCGHLVHPDDQTMDIAEIGRLVYGESKAFLCDLRYIHAGGSTLWVRVQASAFKSGPHGDTQIIAVVEDITKRKRIEETLHNSEAGLRSVLDSSRDLIYRLNLQTGRYEYISPSCESVIGYPAEKIMALGDRAILDLVHPDDLTGVKAKLARLEVSGTEEAEGRFFKAGEYRWYSNRMHLIRDSSGRMLYRDGVVRDITAQKRREANLAFIATVQDDLVRLTSFEEIMQAVGAKIGSFLNVSFSFFAEIDTETKGGRLSHIWKSENVPGLPEAIRLSDYLKGSLYPDRKVEAVIIRDTENDPHTEPQAFRTIQMRSFIIVPSYRFPEWKVVLIIADSRPREWREDEIEVIREFSNRVFPRLERAQAEAALREREAKLHSILNAAPVGVGVVVNRVFSEVNSTLCKMLGYTEDELLGKKATMIYPSDEISDYVGKVKYDMMKAKGIGTVEVPMRRKDGSLIEAIMSSTPVDPRNPEKGTTFTVLDITKRKQAEQALQKAKDELEERVRERTAQLMDINNSLMKEIEQRNLIEAKLRTAQRNLRAMAAEVVMAEERSRQHFATDLHDTVVQTLGAAKLRAQFIQDQIPEESQPILAELQEMLSESITQARSIMAEMSPPVLNELGIAPALEWLTEQIGNQHAIHVIFQCNLINKDVSLAREIEVLLFQAARELLMNVVKHSDATNATVRFSGSDKKVRIAVSDNGKGFDIKKSFEPDLKGGYGLYSIRERLRHIGGYLAIRSKPGQGTTIIVIAPRKETINHAH